MVEEEAARLRAAGTTLYNVQKFDEAVKHWEEAAKKGDTTSMINLGFLHMEKYKSLTTAEFWLNRAVNRAQRSKDPLTVLLKAHYRLAQVKAAKATDGTGTWDELLLFTFKTQVHFRPNVTATDAKDIKSETEPAALPKVQMESTIPASKYAMFLKIARLALNDGATVSEKEQALHNLKRTAGKAGVDYEAVLSEAGDSNATAPSLLFPMRVDMENVERYTLIFEKAATANKYMNGNRTIVPAYLDMFVQAIANVHGCEMMICDTHIKGQVIKIMIVGPKVVADMVLDVIRTVLAEMWAAVERSCYKRVTDRFQFLLGAATRFKETLKQVADADSSSIVIRKQVEMAVSTWFDSRKKFGYFQVSKRKADKNNDAFRAGERRGGTLNASSAKQRKIMNA
jgi:hypothetical protein